MKRLLLILFAIFLITSPVQGEFFKDVILSSPTGIWTDSRAYTTLNAAVAAIGASEQDLYIAKEEAVTTLVIPANIRLHFLKAGAIANSNTLTLNTKNIHADHQIFTGAGAVNFTPGTEVRSVWFEDFETAITQTSNDTVTLTVDTTDTLLNSAAVGNNVLLKWNASNLITIAAGQTLSNIGDISASDLRLFVILGNISFNASSSLNGLSANWFGESLTTLKLADTAAAAAGKQLIFSGAWVIDTDLALSSNPRVLSGTNLQIATTKTLTINGSLDAGHYQIFDCVGTGKVVLGPGAINRVYPEWWATNTAPGTTDMYGALQAALTAGAGKIVQLSDTSYYTSATLLASDGTTLQGHGWNSILTTDINDAILSNASTASTGITNFTLRHLRLNNTYTVMAGAGSTAFHVRFANPISCLVDHVHFWNALVDTDYNTANRGGVWFEITVGSTRYCVLNRVNESLVQRGSVRFDTSDSSITNSYVWGYTGDYAIMLNNSDINVLNCGGIIGSKSHGGVYITAGNLQKISNNYFGGSFLTGIPDNGFGIVAVAGGNRVISGNTFDMQDSTGIYLENPRDTTIIGNVFQEGNSHKIVDHPVTGPDIELKGVGAGFPYMVTISGNVFQRTTNYGDSTDYAIEFSGTFAQKCTVTGNIFDGAGRYPAQAVNYAAWIGAYNKMVGNVGHGTEVISGTFTPVLTDGVHLAACSTESGIYTLDSTGRCFFSITMVTSNITGVVGPLLIASLPFGAAANPQSAIFFEYFSGVTCTTNYTVPSAVIQPSVSHMALYQSGSGQTVTTLTHANIAIGTSIKISGSYIVSAQ